MRVSVHPISKINIALAMRAHTHISLICNLWVLYTVLLVFALSKFINSSTNSLVKTSKRSSFIRPENVEVAASSGRS